MAIDGITLIARVSPRVGLLKPVNNCRLIFKRYNTLRDIIAADVPRLSWMRLHEPNNDRELAPGEGHFQAGI